MLTEQKTNAVIHEMLKAFYQSISDAPLKSIEMLSILTMFNAQVIAKMSEHLLCQKFRTKNVTYDQIFNELKEMLTENLRSVRVMDMKDATH